MLEPKKYRPARIANCFSRIILISSFADAKENEHAGFKTWLSQQWTEAYNPGSIVIAFSENYGEGNIPGNRVRPAHEAIHIP
jgi:hypothetical protein